MSGRFVAILMVVFSVFLSFSPSFGQDNRTDEELIRQTLTQYIEAFNSRDPAKAMGYWMDGAEYTAANRDKIKGADKIKKRLVSFFKNNEKAKITQLAAPRILSIAPNMAVARGLIKLELAENGSFNFEQTATFSKQGNSWKIMEMKDQAVYSVERYTKLSEISWLIGEWVDQDNSNQIESKFEWAPNKSFIIGEFKVKLDDNVTLLGNHIIGLDPTSKVIKSWIFDSNGGVGEGVWSKDGSGWAQNITTTLADGRKVTSINIYRPDGPDRLLWRSLGREVAGQPLPNIEEVVIVRKTDKLRKFNN